MNWRALEPGGVAAASLLIGGLLLVAFPKHAMSIVHLVVVTVAVAAGIYGLVGTVPEWSGAAWRMSPFASTRLGSEARMESRDIERIRAALGGRRQAIQDGPPMPADAIRLLQPLIRAALEREGLATGGTSSTEMGGGEARGAGVDRPGVLDEIAPLSLLILGHEPLQWRPWYHTRRPAPRRVAEVVLRVLDECRILERGEGMNRGRSRENR